MRFGLIGTGYWAQYMHAPALSGHPRADLVGVWGRRFSKAQELAGEHRVRPYRDVSALLDDVDAVAIAVPPDIQGALAIRAAKAGCHLLLEKPICFSLDEAARVLAEVQRAGLRSVVFFTYLLSPGVNRWLREVQAGSGWAGAQVTLRANLFEEGNPFGLSDWRRRIRKDSLALWDLGPHAVGLALALLGPAERVIASEANDGSVYLLIRHRRGAASEVSLSVTTPTAATVSDACVYGSRGTISMPLGEISPTESLNSAIECLVNPDGRLRTPYDARFGVEVVAVLQAAEDFLRKPLEERTELIDRR